VFTGSSTDKEVVVIDLEDSNKVCENLADIASGVTSASGLLFDDSMPMYCGGYYSFYKCECFGYKEGEWMPLAPISPCRHFSGSAPLVMHQDQKPAFVLAGGYGINGILSKVEYFDGSIWNSLPALPEPVYGHCMVAINDTVLLLIGGATVQLSAKPTFTILRQTNGHRVLILTHQDIGIHVPLWNGKMTFPVN